MSSEADQYMAVAATSAQNNEALFKSKKWVYSVDSNSNGGNFGQEIQFDLGILGSQADYTLLSEAQIDLTVFTTVSSDNALFSTTVAAATFNKDLTIIKNGSHHFVHAAALNIDGRSIQDFQNYQNISTHADMMTSFSQEELNKYSSTLHMSKIPEDYSDFENTASATVLTASGFNICDTTKNPSALERKNTQCNGSTGLASTIGNSTTAGHTMVQTATVGASGFTAGSIVAGQYVYVKADTITIRLKDIVPAVKNLPPIKNLKGILYIKVNAIEAKLTSAGSTSGLLSITSVTSTAGSSCPVQMLCSSGALPNLLSTGVATAAGAWTLRCGPLGVNPSSTLQSPKAAHVNARLICPKYEANPAVDAALSMKKTFTVIERRSTRVSLAAQQGNTFNINSGVANPRFVRVYPFFSGVGESGSAIPASYNPLMSLVSSEGATTSPLAQLTNFNVYVGNKSIFQDSQNFDYENFMYEISKLGANGGMDSTMNSGLINSYLWEHFYRYYCADVSRRLSSEDGNMKSIQVQATNGTKLGLDLFVDTFSERQHTIDTSLCKFV